MEMSFTFIPLLIATLIIAFLYSSVGHGGASGYLAILSFYSLSPTAIATSALLLNLLVAGVSFYAFCRASHFSWSLTWPFVIASMPAAFIGGMLYVPREIYSVLLIGVFLIAAIRLWSSEGNEISVIPKKVPLVCSLLVGFLLGLLSGIVGVGGGVFLSPLLLFLSWANAKQVAATAAFFIWVNSLMGLMGRFYAGQFGLSSTLLVMMVLAFVGTVIGSRMGAVFFTSKTVRKTLSFVLIIATFKLCLSFM